MANLQAEVERDQLTLEDYQSKVAELAAGLKVKRGILLDQKDKQLAELGKDLSTLPTLGLKPIVLEAKRESFQYRIADLKREIGDLKRMLGRA